MDDYLNPEPASVLEEILERHRDALAVSSIGVDLSFQAARKSQHLEQSYCPGIPHLRRHFNVINDFVWRFVQYLCIPLVEDGRIREFKDLEGGMVMVMPDGLPIRIKKGDKSGRTSNYQTNHVKQMRSTSHRLLYRDAHDLDLYIADGQIVDLVYCVGDHFKNDFEHLLIRFANAKVSPSAKLDFPSDDVLHKISTDAYRRVEDYRTKISG